MSGVVIPERRQTKRLQILTKRRRQLLLFTLIRTQN